MISTPIKSLPICAECNKEVLIVTVKIVVIKLIRFTYKNCDSKDDKTAKFIFLSALKMLEKKSRINRFDSLFLFCFFSQLIHPLCISFFFNFNFFHPKQRHKATKSQGVAV